MHGTPGHGYPAQPFGVVSPKSTMPPPTQGFGMPRFGARKKPETQDNKFIKTSITVTKGFWQRLQAVAKNLHMSEGEYLMHALPYLTVDPPQKEIADSVSDTVTGRHRGKPVKTKVTTLLGPEQIFDAWIKVINQTEKYAQIAMYNFENEFVEGGRGVDGADVSPGWKKQQQVLGLIERKARQGVRFMFILDNSVVRERDEFGNPIFPRRHTNAGMIEHLRKLKEEEGLPIDVVEFPRSVAHIYHVKLLISDGKRAIVGGMNMSNHSAANWDACVLLEGREVANLQSSTFHPDWVLARHRKDKQLSLEQIRAELPQIDPVSHPAIKVLNTFPREYAQIGANAQEGIGDYIKGKLQDKRLKEIHSEQFIATHKEIKEKLIALHKAGKNIRMLHSSSVVDQFPYSRKAVYDMMRHGVPVRFYNEWEEIGQKLHSKWTVFNKDEILIGSANLSARGLETNVRPGIREDYPNFPGQRYTRGNRDMAIVIKSRKIAQNFLKQFNYDWEHSPPQHPDGYGLFEKTTNAPEFEAVTKKVVDILA